MVLPLDPLSRVLPPLRPGTRGPRRGTPDNNRSVGDGSETESETDTENETGAVENETGAVEKYDDRGDDREYDRAQQAEDGPEDDGHLFDDYA